MLNLKEEALKRDALEDRLVFSVVASYDEQIKRGILADLFLDTAGLHAMYSGLVLLCQPWRAAEWYR